MAFTRTRERQFARMRVALQEQAAEGSLITDFASGTGAMVWARSALFNENPQFESFQGTHGSVQERSQGMFHTHHLPGAEIRFYPTPLIMREILRSFAGPFSGTAVTWPQGIDTFFSFLFAEAKDGDSGFRAYRYEDAWVRELEFNIGGFGVAECTARIIAQNVTEFATDAAGLERQQAGDGLVDLFAHGIGRNWLIGVTAHPAGGIERGVLRFLVIGT